MKLAVIGAGYWGRNIIRVCLELGILGYICDKNTELKKIYLEKYPYIEFVDNFEVLLEKNDIDGFIVSSPAETHYFFVEKILKIGKNVFVEKPLALNSVEGIKLIEIAQKNNCILMVGHILHYHPAVRKMKEIIEKGEIGKIQYIYSNRLNIGRIRHEENILWSFAPHDISLLLSITKEFPKKVFSHGGIYLPHNVEDVTLTFFQFPSGINAHIFVSWLNPFKEQKFVVIGNKKMIVFDDTQKNRKLVLYSHEIKWKNDEIPEIKKYEGQVIDVEENEPLKEEIKHFIECIEKRKRPITDGEEGVRVLKVLEMAQQSLKEERKNGGLFCSPDFNY